MSLKNLINNCKTANKGYKNTLLAVEEYLQPEINKVLTKQEQELVEIFLDTDEGRLKIGIRSLPTMSVEAMRIVVKLSDLFQTDLYFLRKRGEFDLDSEYYVPLHLTKFWE